MKKLLFSIIALSGITGASAQKYIPFPASNAVWTQREGKGDTAPAFSVIGLKADDTMILGMAYHKLYLSKDMKLDASEYCGAIREDGAKHIWFFNAKTGSEYLLYDFSIGVGDTIHDPMTGTASGTVLYIDSVNISGVYHKRFNFGQLPSSAFWPAGAWIEGIGNSSLGGLLGATMRQPTCDCATDIVCFKEDGKWQYHNPKYASLDCDQVLVLNTETIRPVGTTVHLYPNPVKGSGELRITGDVYFTTMTVYDMQGRVVRSVNIDKDNNTGLGKNDFAPGMYLYRLQNDNGNSAVGKLIVE